MRRCYALPLLAACADPPPDAEPAARDGALGEIAFTGDVLLGDGAQDDLDEHGYDWPFEQLVPPLADLLVGNAEGPITTRPEPYNPDQTWSYNALPAAAPALARFGFGALGLSNNHVWDRGPDGFRDTITHLDATTAVPFGAGEDRTEAATPISVDTPAGRVAIVAFSQRFGFVPAATAATPGVLRLDADDIAFGAQQARDGGADHLVAYVHWGSNYSVVEPRQLDAANLLALAGFSVVVGHHPHVVQRVDLHESFTVIYSLGNFVFGTPGRFTDEFPGYGLIATLGWDTDGLATASFDCIRTDNDVVRYQPRPCDEDERLEAFETLGVEFVLDGERAVVAVPR